MHTDPRLIAIADYDYPLPEHRIAKFPLQERDASKLLVYNKGSIDESHFRKLPALLPPDTMLVFNNTKVIHARLLFRKATGSHIEIFCLEPWQMPFAQSFEQRSRCSWLCFVGNNKKWKADTQLELPFAIGDKQLVLNAMRRQAVGNAWVVDFMWDGEVSFAEVVEHAGVIPLPPYLNRKAETSDNSRYQTIYANPQGSVAAPTAGLHFTEQVFNDLGARHIATEYVTLHVGAGTFKPVGSDLVGEHDMHTEKVVVTCQNLRHLLHHLPNPIVAVGTTSVRTLESVYWFGVQLASAPHLEAMHVGQWEPYENAQKTISTAEALGNVLQWMERNDTDTLQGDTRLLIAPSYKFHVINGLVTNFHQPRSTLLLLVSALIGDDWRECYRYALDHDFRFLSYGDSCLFLP
ncbi:MAG: S-adenosylmethionine:tRNA ribosyltransferase-isomerase [Bacteroidales bacterium]|nr:S-adenosylmethionine:tRNA ribosyltransferase-isomerase [Bacteroidales bacterium]